MERSPMFLDSRINIVKMAILPKVLYRFNAIPIKIPMTFLIEMEKAIMKFIWKNKRPRTAKAILGRKSDAGGVTLLDLKLYYRATVTKTSKVLALKQTGRTMVQNRRHRDKLILDKGAKNIQWRKDSLFNKWCWENWKFICSKMELSLYLSPCIKLNSK